LGPAETFVPALIFAAFAGSGAADRYNAGIKAGQRRIMRMRTFPNIHVEVQRAGQQWRRSLKNQYKISWVGNRAAASASRRLIERLPNC